jgi:hypothetical protein
MFILMLQAAPHTTALPLTLLTRFTTHDTSLNCQVNLFVLHHSHRLRVDLSDGMVRDSSNTSHCRRLVDGLPFLSDPLCCLLQRAYDPTSEMSVLEGLLGRIFARNRQAPGSLSSLFLDFRVSRH